MSPEERPIVTQTSGEAAEPYSHDEPRQGRNPTKFVREAWSGGEAAETYSHHRRKKKAAK